MEWNPEMDTEKWENVDMQRQMSMPFKMAELLHLQTRHKYIRMCISSMGSVGKKSGRVPFDMDSEANSYKCQVKLWWNAIYFESGEK